MILPNKSKSVRYGYELGSNPMIFGATYKKTRGASVPLKHSLVMIRESAGWSS